MVGMARRGRTEPTEKLEGMARTVRMARMQKMDETGEMGGMVLLVLPANPDEMEKSDLRARLDHGVLPVHRGRLVPAHARLHTAKARTLSTARKRATRRMSVHANIVVTKEEHAVLRSMFIARRSAEKGTAIIATTTELRIWTLLFLMPCNIDTATQEVLKYTSTADPEGNRTSRMLTKPKLKPDLQRGGLK